MSDIDEWDSEFIANALQIRDQAVLQSRVEAAHRLAGPILLIPTPGMAAAALVGQWDFEDPAHLAKGTVGKDLVVVGSAVATPGVGSSDGAADIRVGSFFRCLPDLAPNGGSTTFVNEYTMVFDLFLPISSDQQWRCLFQMTDGDYFISPGNTMGVAELTYSAKTISAGSWYRIILSADIGSNIDNTAPSSSFLKTVNDLFGNSWTHRHAAQALNGRHALRSTANGNAVLFFADENGEDGLLRVSRIQLLERPLSAPEAKAMGGPFPPDPCKCRPDGGSRSRRADFRDHRTAGLIFLAADDDDDAVMITVDWGNGTTSSNGFLPAGQAQVLAHAWSQAGNYPLGVHARDEHGATSPWTTLQSIAVTGATTVTFRTPLYLQNVRVDGIVIMTETSQNVPLAVEFGTSTAFGSTQSMSRVASGGGTWFHRAVLTGLAPAGEYFYRLLSGPGEPLTTPSHFHTAPAHEVDFKFSAWGDSQGHNHGAWTANPLEPTISMMKHMVESGVAFGLANGDPAEDGNSYSDTRSFYLDRVAAHLGPSAPWFAAWGNHDTNNPSSPLRLASDMPSRYRSGFSPGHGCFTFTYSNCFFVCIDYFFDADITNGWLEAQLASPEARNARFRFLGVHVPPFCERWIDGDARLRTSLVPLLELAMRTQVTKSDAAAARSNVPVFHSLSPPNLPTRSIANREFPQYRFLPSMALIGCHLESLMA